MENRTLYLIRHGKIAQPDDQRRYIGQIDLPLTPEGVRQAQRLQMRFERVKISAVYCSDLACSRKTAEIIVGSSRNIPIFSRPELREVGMGEWEGCTFGEIAARFPAEFQARGADIAHYRVPGGESFADCSGRAVAAFEEMLRNSEGNLLIVGYAGLNRLLLCHVLGMPISHLFRISQDYGCLNTIQCTGSGYQVRLVNGRARLSQR
jgi:probable phosphoglycerate mutase